MNDKLPGGALEYAVKIFIDHCGMATPEARDTIIHFFLERGDMRAFRYFVLNGHRPSQEVLRHVSYLTMTREEVEEWVPGLGKFLKFKLVREHRDGEKEGSRPDTALEIRDWAIAENVRGEMRGSGQYDAAIEAVYEQLEGYLSKGSIRRIYDKHYGKKAKKSEGPKEFWNGPI